MGFGIAFPQAFRLSDHGLLIFVVFAWTFNNFTSGIFQTPTNELMIGTVPGYLMGRLNGYINSAGMGLTIVATIFITYTLHRLNNSLYALGVIWAVSAIVMWAPNLLLPILRERAACTVESPVPWSKKMFLAAWNDKPYARLMGAYTIVTILIGGMGQFISVYATQTIPLGGLGLPAEVVSNMITVGAVTSAICCFVAGFIIDRFGARKLLPLAVTGQGIGGLVLVLSKTGFGLHAAGAVAGSWASRCPLWRSLTRLDYMGTSPWAAHSVGLPRQP